MKYNEMEVKISQGREEETKKKKSKLIRTDPPRALTSLGSMVASCAPAVHSSSIVPFRQRFNGGCRFVASRCDSNNNKFTRPVTLRYGVPRAI